MEHPYRVHSSIGFGFLQLLFISSLAYPSPPPPVYHNIAVTRLMGTVYYTIFQDKPFYLKLECLTILLEIICDALYIRYIIQDYTYIFGVLDICSNALFCVFVILSIKNGDIKTEKFAEKMDEIRKTCVSCCFGWRRNEQSDSNVQYEYEQPLRPFERTERTVNTTCHLYKSLPSDEFGNANPRTSLSQQPQEEAPVYTFGGRQAFKPSFYNSSWGKDYIQSKVEREFDKIEKRDTEIGDVGMITGTDGTTQYIRFDEFDAAAAGSTGINHYANLFVSPYFMRDGTPITWFSGCTNIDKIGVCLFIYNVIQFIYQLMMYSSIVTSCREYVVLNNITNTTTSTSTSTATIQTQRWLC